jgi:phosphatidylglycerophosphate synthase
MKKAAYTPDRRPITSRERASSKALAAWLAARGVSPNAISTVGMLAGVCAGAAFVGSGYGGQPTTWLMAAAVLIQLRLLCNMLDGMVAVATHRASPLGELFNEVPDRIADSAIFIGAGHAIGGNPTWGYLAALAALFTAYLRAQGKVAGAHQEFCGPLAKPQRMFLMTLAAFYAALAPAGWQWDAPPGWGGGTIGLTLLVVSVGSGWTAVRRLRRIARALDTA